METVKTIESVNGTLVEFVERDCGDYLEYTPRGTFGTYGGIAISQSVNGIGDDLSKGSNILFRFPFPLLVLKIPKNLPQDSTERMKVLIQVRNVAMRNLLGYLEAAVKKSNEMASSNPDQVKVVEQDTDEVKKKKKD